MNVIISYPDGREEIVENCDDPMEALAERFPDRDDIIVGSDNQNHAWIDDEDIDAYAYDPE
jgi:hypothetical protein